MSFDFPIYTLNQPQKFAWKDTFTPTEPPIARRKPNAEHRSEGEWDEHKEKIIELYGQHGLSELMRIMEKDEGFSASLSQYRRHLNTWRKRKYKSFTKQELSCMLQVIYKRMEAGKQKTAFRLNGERVPSRALERNLLRNLKAKAGDIILSQVEPERNNSLGKLRNPLQQASYTNITIISPASNLRSRGIVAFSPKTPGSALLYERVAKQVELARKKRNSEKDLRESSPLILNSLDVPEHLIDLSIVGLVHEIFGRHRAATISFEPIVGVPQWYNISNKCNDHALLEGWLPTKAPIKRCPWSGPIRISNEVEDAAALRANIRLWKADFDMFHDQHATYLRIKRALGQKLKHRFPYGDVFCIVLTQTALAPEVGIICVDCEDYRFQEIVVPDVSHAHGYLPVRDGQLEELLGRFEKEHVWTQPHQKNVLSRICRSTKTGDKLEQKEPIDSGTKDMSLHDLLVSTDLEHELDFLCTTPKDALDPAAETATTSVTLLEFPDLETRNPFELPASHFWPTYTEVIAMRT